MQSIPGEGRPVNRGSELKRTPFKRKAPAPAKARSAVRARSAKREKVYREVRVPIIRAAMDAGQLCEAAASIASVDLAAAMRCQIRAVDWHEVKTRGRGGSITDAANRLWACRRCHDWIDGNPALARVAGVVLNSWDPDP